MTTLLNRNWGGQEKPRVRFSNSPESQRVGWGTWLGETQPPEIGIFVQNQYYLHECVMDKLMYLLQRANYLGSLKEVGFWQLSHFVFTSFITVWFLKRLSKALVRQRYTDTHRTSSLRWSRGGRPWRWGQGGWERDQSMVLAGTHNAPDPGCTPSCKEEVKLDIKSRKQLCHWF